MGITNNCANFLFFAKERGVKFNHTLMLGRLNLFATKDCIKSNIEKYKLNVAIEGVTFPDEYSEPLFKILGATNVDSLDFSDYEKATIIHDLNNPISSELYKKFDCIVDGGTIEHVFNFPVAIKNCMQALRVGGHFIGITPVNNTMGHGFYQFSPELFYRVFAKENGFEVSYMVITPQGMENSNWRWFEVADPKLVNSRMMLVNNVPTYILFIAKKVEEREIFTSTPQQSDYANTWLAHDSMKTGVKPEGVSVTKHLYRKLVPKRVKTIIRNVYDIMTKENAEIGELGNVSALHFKEVEY